MMKTQKNLRPFLLSLCLALAFFVAGCGVDEDGRTGTPADAPADYLRALNAARNSAQVQTEMATMQNAIRMFQAQEGRYPQSLQELQSEGYLPAVPTAPRGTRYQYDSSSGSVELVADAP